MGCTRFDQGKCLSRRLYAEQLRLDGYRRSSSKNEMRVFTLRRPARARRWTGCVVRHWPAIWSKYNSGAADQVGRWYPPGINEQYLSLNGFAVGKFSQEVHLLDGDIWPQFGM